jgi:hypothetical protein
MKRLRSGLRADSHGVLLPLTGVLALLGTPGCRDGGQRAPEPRAAASESAGRAAGVSSAKGRGAPPCRAPAGLTADAELAAWFPVVVGGHCLDPHADVQRHGGKTNPPLTGACAALGVECDLPLRLGLERVVSVRYVDVTSALERVTASIWSFRDAEAALAYLTERVAVDAELGQRPTLFDAGAGGVLYGSRAAFVRGSVVALFELEDERTTHAERVRRALFVLPVLARSIGVRLPGDTRLPRAVELLPAEGQSLDVLRYEGFDLFGISGVGRAARARYEDPKGMRDVVALVRQDEDAADDVLATLRKVDGARRIKGAPYGAIRLRQTEGTRVPMDWVFGRKGTVVLGVGAPVVVTPKKKGAPKPPDESLLELKRLLDRTAGS